MADISITQMRQGLGYVRRAWQCHTPFSPFNPSEIMTGASVEESVASFAFRSLLVNRKKRGSRTTKATDKREEAELGVGPDASR